MMKRKHDDDEHSTEMHGDINKLLGELQPAKKLLKNLLKKGRQSKEDLHGSVTKESEDEVETEGEEGSEEDFGTASENESDLEIEEEVVDSTDPFSVHFEQTLEENIVDAFKSNVKMQKVKTFKKAGMTVDEFSFENMKDISEHIVEFNSPLLNFGMVSVKEKLSQNWSVVNKAKKSKENLTGLQRELLKPIFSYQDLCYTGRNFHNGEEIRKLYSLHAVNHVLKTRTKFLKHNAKLQSAAEAGIGIEEELRDQGITRPKVLIVVPFKDSCLKIVNVLKKLLFGNEKKVQIMNKKRFQKEFSSDEASHQGYRPEDFKLMFEGNIDDGFRIGISLSKNTMKLYTHFYSSDIIIASPLGLRTLIGGKGEKQDFDFLSSIELLIIDQAEVFLMQNWDHLITVLDHINRRPKSTHDTDISRVRMWSINEWSRYYRQNLIFSSFPTPEINSIFNRYFQNFAGKTKWVVTDSPGTVQHVVSEIPQVFRRINVDDYASLPDKRFEFFVDQMLPDLVKNQKSIAIYIPSYFDFVRVRNYMKKEEIGFVQISEYTKKSYSSHARTLFREGRKQFLIFTGRFFFYYRYRITGIRNLVFYDIPLYPQFYPEVVNFIKTDDKEGSPSCTALFSRYDALKLQGVVGTERMKKMMSGKAVHMIVTGK
eukprot:TCONS_00054861-protein